VEQERQWFSRSSTGSCLEPKLVGVVDALPTVFVLFHDVLMREDVVAACTAFEVPQGVILTGIGLDNSKVIAGAFRAFGVHRLIFSK
jgi:hypothetical protein